MQWNLDENRPIYSQLIEQLTHAIAAGEFKPGDKLASVRDMAAEASVNPNTMQKAMSEMERLGLVYTQRTSGRFITEDEAMIKQIKIDIAREQIAQFLETMQGLGFTHEEILQLLSQYQK